MKTIEQGDILYIKFGPSEGHEYEKTRPAIVLTKSDVIKHSAVITVVPLTSKLDNSIADDILIKRDKINNLFSDSIIKMRHMTACNHSTRFKKYIGRVDPETWRKIQEKILRFDF